MISGVTRHEGDWMAFSFCDEVTLTVFRCDIAPVEGGMTHPHPV